MKNRSAASMNLGKLLCVSVLLASVFTPLARASLFAPQTSTKEYERVFTTYPYSDPDPIPAITRYYPYFRYDGFTDQPVQKKWKVVELSNDYIQLLILPEVGGKVWAAIEKKTGRPFLYFNHVVKFRDVSMRGPWTSGGMEANYGIIGHTPNCFSPVDYVVRHNADGSASCIIGTLDLLTRTSWRLEITLPADQAGFTTRSFWHNSSTLDQPYYTWMNVGIKAAGNLQFVNPGNHYLGHDGQVFSWPTNSENGHNISWYDQNNFGGYKSYHVFGQYSEFFGGYYHDDDFGMAHCAAYGDKPGRKVWIWGLSRQGMIWEKLLTDTNGQYVEVQSGRLFNQTADESSVTPFKHKEFSPYASDTWTEYWEPVKGTKGFVSASPWGALNVTRDGQQLAMRLSPTRSCTDDLEVFDGTNQLWSEKVSLQPMQTVEKVMTLASEPKSLKVSFGGDKLLFVAGNENDLSRPVTSPTNFDWSTDFGLYLKGKENSRERAYLQAETNFQACLSTNPNYSPALVEMAALANRRADSSQAADFARHALSIDTYDPEANYQFGLASVALGRTADAKDAFSIAALAPGWRSAANTELAKVYLRQKQYDRALICTTTSLDYDRRNIDALQLQACLGRLSGDKAVAEQACKQLLEIDPLNHFARFEKNLRGKGTSAEFTSLIRNELPQETYLELAAWYRNAGLDQDAARVLDLAPPTAEVLYWLAYLRQDTQLLARAEAASPAFVFPFRTESVPVFEWAGQMSQAWQPRYFLALIRWSQGKVPEARQLLDGCGDTPQFGPFYAARAQFAGENTVGDLEKAAQLEPAQWRYGAMLVKHYLAHTNSAAALTVATQNVKLFPTNTVLDLLYAKTLILTGQFQSASTFLNTLNILPCEGSTEAHSMLRGADLMLAVDQMKAGAFDTALQLITQAQQWPENLGAGQPYAEDDDARLEDWLAYRCYLQTKAADKANAALEKILAFNPSAKTADSGIIVRALALKAAGRTEEAEKLLSAWKAKATDSTLPDWALALLAGKQPDLPPDTQDVVVNVLAAWARLLKS